MDSSKTADTSGQEPITIRNTHDQVMMDSSEEPSPSPSRETPTGKNDEPQCLTDQTRYVKKSKIIMVRLLQSSLDKHQANSV